MFPSGGFFKKATCPFYIHGLCHRPYCHFRHARPKKENNGETQSSVSSIVTEENKGNDEVQSELVYIPSKIIPPVPSVQETESASFDDAIFSDELMEIGGRDEQLEIDSDKHENAEASKARKRNQPIPKKKTPLESSLADAVPVIDVQELLQLPDIVPEVTLPAVIPKSKETKEEIKLSAKDPLEDVVLPPKKLVKAPPPKLADVDFFGEVSMPKSKKLKRASTTASKRRPTEEAAVAKRPKVEVLSDCEIDSFLDDSDNEGALKTLFDEYDTSSIEKPPAGSQIKSRPTIRKAEPVVETVGLGSIKKRIAHGEYHEGQRKCPVIQKKNAAALARPSYVSPTVSSGLPNGMKKSSSSSTSSAPKKPAPLVGFSFATTNGEYVGRSRVAHIVPAQPKIARPRIQVEYGAKVPQLVRQRYLDKIVDEFLLKMLPDQEAYAKAVEEESLAYQRCTRKQIYMNLCVNIIKRVRSMPVSESRDNPCGVAIADPMVTASPTVTPSSGHLIASKRIPAASSKLQKTIRPSNSSLASTKAKHSSLINPKSTGKRRSSQEIPKLTEVLFYDHLLKYVASDEELWENGYPRSSDDVGVARINNKRTTEGTATKPNCQRCGRQFLLTEEEEYITTEECHFHWGRLRRMRGHGEVSMQYQCCQGEAGSTGCCAAQLHIPNRPPSLDGFISTFEQPVASKKVFSLDCEMSYTVKGLELTRVTVVNFNLEQIYDTFVVPAREIIDYNTRFSGVTEESLRGVRTSLQDVQAVLLSMFHKDVILMGHSLESDLKALKLIHDKVVDTALVFPHRLGLPYKRALRNLMADHLKKIIQEHEGGHDSYEDSAACMQLMQWKINEDLQREVRKKIHV